MSAKIYWDFAVNRWAQTMTEIAYRDGPDEVDLRCANLPEAFKTRLIANLKGEDTNDRPY